MSENEKTRLRSASNSKLPIASVIDDPDLFREVVDLLRKSVEIKSQQSELEDADKDIRERLGAICASYDLKGLRHGRAGFEYHGYTTRKTLSRERLLELGVAADVIAEAYVEGDPFMFAKVIAFDLD